MLDPSASRLVESKKKILQLTELVRNNIQQTIRQEEPLENLESKSLILQTETSDFLPNTRRVRKKMCCNLCKHRCFFFCLGFLVGILLALYPLLVVFCGGLRLEQCRL